MAYFLDAVCALVFVPARHADIATLQVLQRDHVGGFVTQGVANLIQGKARGFLEFEVAQTEGGIKQAGQDRQQLLLLLGEHELFGARSQDVSQVAQRLHGVSLGLANLIAILLAYTQRLRATFLFGRIGLVLGALREGLECAWQHGGLLAKQVFLCRVLVCLAGLLLGLAQPSSIEAVTSGFGFIQGIRHQPGVNSLERVGCLAVGVEADLWEWGCLAAARCQHHLPRFQLVADLAAAGPLGVVAGPPQFSTIIGEEIAHTGQLLICRLAKLEIIDGGISAVAMLFRLLCPVEPVLLGLLGAALFLGGGGFALGPVAQILLGLRLKGQALLGPLVLFDASASFLATSIARALFSGGSDFSASIA